MKALKTIRNYIFYCGIEKDEYEAIKKDAYKSNFKLWRTLHIFMAVVFGFLYFTSLMNNLLRANSIFYLSAFIYSAVSIVFFYVLKNDSVLAQFLIYLSISLLFLFGCLITQNKPATPATTFIALLLITPMFMIDKPIFMTIELCAASSVFVVWMHGVKPYSVWEYDLVNVVIYTVVGIFLNVIANSIRIREFVLTRKIRIQKDTDELTGLKNKAALTREINEFLANNTTGKGIMLLLDVDHFKSINDTYGHDVGDRVITQLGQYLGSRCTDDEVAGRFGGDEFIVFIKNSDSPDTAAKVAQDIVRGASESVNLPDIDQRIELSVGIAIYHGKAKNYSEIFKRADTALYKAKADTENRYCIYR